MKEEKPYNPLDKRNLGVSVADALLAQQILPLKTADSFFGAGIYAIYYDGNFKPYRPIAERNRNSIKAAPIYVGKAVPPGARKGGFDLDVGSVPALYNRLREHAESIEQAKNLNIDDFSCRYLLVDDIWIPLGETMMIDKFHPVWNQVIEGFGNHNPGKGRYQQQRSPWDVLHPGRTWAARCAECNKSEQELLAALGLHLGNTLPKKMGAD